MALVTVRSYQTAREAESDCADLVARQIDAYLLPGCLGGVSRSNWARSGVVRVQVDEKDLTRAIELLRGLREARIKSAKRI